MTAPENVPQTTARKTVSKEERLRSGAAMVLDHDHHGLTWPEVAKKHEVPLRTVHRRVKAYRQSLDASPASASPRPSPLTTSLRGEFPVDPLEEARSLIDAYEQAIRRYDEISGSDTQDNYRIAATARGLEAKIGRFQALQALGVLPPHLAHWRVIEETQRLSLQLSLFLAREDIPDDTIRRFMHEMSGNWSSPSWERADA